MNRHRVDLQRTGGGVDVDTEAIRGDAARQRRGSARVDIHIARRRDQLVRHNRSVRTDRRRTAAERAVDGDVRVGRGDVQRAVDVYRIGDDDVTACQLDVVGNGDGIAELFVLDRDASVCADGDIAVDGIEDVRDQIGTCHGRGRSEGDVGCSVVDDQGTNAGQIGVLADGRRATTIAVEVGIDIQSTVSTRVVGINDAAESLQLDVLAFDGDRAVVTGLQCRSAEGEVPGTVGDASVGGQCDRAGSRYYIAGDGHVAVGIEVNHAGGGETGSRRQGKIGGCIEGRGGTGHRRTIDGDRAGGTVDVEVAGSGRDIHIDIDRVGLEVDVADAGAGGNGDRIDCQGGAFSIRRNIPTERRHTARYRHEVIRMKVDDVTGRNRRSRDKLCFRTDHCRTAVERAADVDVAGGGRDVDVAGSGINRHVDVDSIALEPNITVTGRKKINALDFQRAA